MCTHRGGPVTGRAGRDIRAGDERVAGRPCVHADRRNRPAGRWPGRDERSAGLALGGTRLQGQCDRDPPSAQAGPSEPESLCPGQVRPSRGVRGGSSPCCWRGPGWSRGVPPLALGAPAQLHVGPAHCPSSRLLSSPAWRLRRPPTLPLRPRLGPKQPLHPAVLPAKREGKSRMMPSGPSRSDKVTCVLGEGEGRGWPSAGVAGGHWGPGSSPPFPGPEWVHSARATRSPP